MKHKTATRIGFGFKNDKLLFIIVLLLMKEQSLKITALLPENKP